MYTASKSPGGGGHGGEGWGGEGGAGGECHGGMGGVMGGEGGRGRGEGTTSAPLWYWSSNSDTVIRYV